MQVLELVLHVSQGITAVVEVHDQHAIQEHIQQLHMQVM
jgi:hypothetical protein